REILDKAPHIFLPVPHVYSAWWPWVKNYGGELRAGADRPGPIHARAWVDQDIKKKGGFGPPPPRSAYGASPQGATPVARQSRFHGVRLVLPWQADRIP
ncbi:MAG TPA: hypothetical protein PKL46_03645, partial [Aquabacterium sp.]|nr:hypothetical protein [Aquabacterium sp.]